ncbi:MAG: hypothetical protein HY909_08230 [Deltaproteobacteria bacterium]|nr:hypothetical protein [Deltaproteobacteria bacterium]
MLGGRSPWLLGAWLALAGCRRVDPNAARCRQAWVQEGAVTLQRCPLPPVTIGHECGERCRQLSRVGNFPTASDGWCLTSRAAWWTAEGNLYRLNLADGASASVLGPPSGPLRVSATGVGCHGDDVLFTATTPAGTRVDLVARFRDGDPEARVLWRDAPPRRDDPPPEHPALSAQWVAWSWSVAVPGVWALNPPSNVAFPVRMDVRPAGPLSADGALLVLQAGSTVENARPQEGSRPVAPTGNAQWSPSAAHGLLAWVDQRDNPAGTLDAPRDPRVYLYDLDRRALRRLSGGPPAWRGSPHVGERWVVWVDARRDPHPDRGPDAAYTRVEVWGYELSTGTERALATDTVAYAPRTAGTRLYFVSPSDGTRRDLYEQELP